MSFLFRWLAVLTLFFLILILISLPSFLLAQEIIIPEDSNYHDLSPEERAIADKFVIDIKRALSSAPLREMGRSEPKGTARNNILLHLKGNAGLEFNQDVERELKSYSNKVIEENKSEMSKLADSYSDQINNFLKEFNKKKPLPLCFTDETKTEDLNLNFSKAHKEVLYDLLFLPKKVLPNDQKKAFGNVGITTVDEQNVALVLEATSIFNINCFPVRIKSTPKATTYYYGLAALKNYDTKPEGELAPDVKALWEDLIYKQSLDEQEFTVR
jgi:hypothetical protein